MNLVNGTWYLGQKPICIDDRFHEGVYERCSSLPIKGEVYTIRRIQSGKNAYTRGAGFGLLLEEIINPRNGEGGEVGFFCDRFPPRANVESAAQNNRQLATYRRNHGDREI